MLLKDFSLNWRQMVQIRISLRQRTRFLAGLWFDDRKKMKQEISECAEAYAILQGIKPHSNPKLIKAKLENVYPRLTKASVKLQKGIEI
jgi:hypothetical protein